MKDYGRTDKSMKAKKSLGINAVMSGLNKGLSIIFPLLTFPYISRVLGVENVGKYNFSNSICSYGMLVASLGVNIYAVREGTKYRTDKEKIGVFSSQIFSINLVLTIIAYVLLIGSLVVSAKLKEYRACILILSISIMFTTVGVNWLYQIYEEYTYITIRNLIFKILSFGLMLLLVKRPEDYLIYAAITVFAAVGANLINFFYARKYCRIAVTASINWKLHLKPLIVLAASNIAVSIYCSSDVTMLGFWTSDYQVGIYSTAARVYGISKSIILAFLSVTIPRLSLYAGQNNQEQFEALIRKVISTMNTLMLPIMTGIFIMSDEVIMLLGGGAYIEGSMALKILSAAILFSMYAWISSECILIPYKWEKVTMISTIAGAGFNIILNVLLIPQYKANAAAFTTVLAELCVMVICTVKAKTVIKLRYLDKSMVTAIFGSVGIIFVCIFVKHFVMEYFSRLIFSISISAGVYFGILLICKNEFVWQIVDIIRDKLGYRTGR